MNPLIAVERALYGTPGIQAVDVTSEVQGIFDQQYQNGQRSPFSVGPISPELFEIGDPSAGNTKTFTITYTLPVDESERSFARGGKDGDTLSIAAGPVTLRVLRAYYGTETFGLDLTQAMDAYFSDPGNSPSLTIGNGDFWRLFCGGRDPAPGTLKSLSLQGQPSPDARIVNFSGVDGQTIDFTIDYTPPNQSWMSDLVVATPALGNLPLREMCLPASHDSGSYDLSATLTADPDFPELVRVLKMVNDQINVIPLISKLINPADWAFDEIVDVARDVAIATHSDILQQLSDGIRCLDLRVCYDENNPSSPFATYHGLLGVPLESVLSSIKYFVSSLAQRGEIVYVTLGHYLTPSGGSRFSQEQLQQLSALVWGLLDPSLVFGPQDMPPGANTLFDCTYSQIINAGTPGASKVILVAPSLPDPPSGAKVWPALRYSPPDAGSSSLFGGSYTNTDSAEAMFGDQVAKSKEARSSGKPFALYLTLTPQPRTIGLLVANRLRNALLVLAAWLPWVPFIGAPLSMALGAVAAVLATYIAGRLAAYSSLESLSGNIFQGPDSTVQAIIANRFTGSQYASPSFIYMDYYEDRTLTNDANKSCAQIVETAKAVWESNS